MVIYSLLQILSEAGGPGNERLRAGGREPGAEGRGQRAEGRGQRAGIKTKDKSRSETKILTVASGVSGTKDKSIGFILHLTRVK